MKTVIYCKKNRGSVSIEAVISVMIFTFAVASLILLMIDLRSQERVRQAAFEVSRQMAVIDVQNEMQCFALAEILWVANPNMKDEHILVTGVDLSEDGTFEIKMRWQLELPFGQKIHHRYSVKNRLLTRGFDGVSQNEDSLVYITNTGAKYHISGCFHLSKSQETMTKKEAVKNGYSPCWHCIGGLKPFEKAPGTLEPSMGKAN